MTEQEVKELIERSLKTQEQMQEAFLMIANPFAWFTESVWAIPVFVFCSLCAAVFTSCVIIALIRL